MHVSMNLIMKTHVRKWGNSIGVRIPQQLAQEIGLTDGTELEMNVINKKIVLVKPRVTLDDLVKKITPENVHKETDTGFLKGKEIW